MCDVLLLEDDDLVRELLVEVLETEGFEVAAFSTAQEALGRIEGLPPCRVLATDIDLGTPEYDGFRVARQARAICANLPVLYLSGRPSNWNDRDFGPCEEFLSKPFGLDAFIGKLKALGVETRA